MFLRPAYFLKDASAATKTTELRGIPSWMVPWWSLAAGNMRRCQRGRVSMSYQVCNMYIEYTVDIFLESSPGDRETRDICLLKAGTYR